MARPADGEYYHEGQRTQHVAQGDVFRDIEFIGPDGGSFTTYGMLIHYTSNMMNGAPGTRGYAHDSRLLAPLYAFDMLSELGITDDHLRSMRSDDLMGRYLYLPPCPNEFDECGVPIYRAQRFTQATIEGKRVAQLQLGAAKQLQRKLARVFFGTELEGEPSPDMTDHWAGS